MGKVLYPSLWRQILSFFSGWVVLPLWLITVTMPGILIFKFCDLVLHQPNSGFLLGGAASLVSLVWFSFRLGLNGMTPRHLVWGYSIHKIESEMVPRILTLYMREIAAHFYLLIMVASIPFKMFKKMFIKNADQKASQVFVPDHKTYPFQLHDHDRKFGTYAIRVDRWEVLKSFLNNKPPVMRYLYHSASMPTMEETDQFETNTAKETTIEKEPAIEKEPEKEVKEPKISAREELMKRYLHASDWRRFLSFFTMWLVLPIWTAAASLPGILLYSINAFLLNQPEVGIWVGGLFSVVSLLWFTIRLGQHGMTIRHFAGGYCVYETKGLYTPTTFALYLREVNAFIIFISMCLGSLILVPFTLMQIKIKRSSSETSATHNEKHKSKAAKKAYSNSAFIHESLFNTSSIRVSRWEVTKSLFKTERPSVPFLRNPDNKEQLDLEDRILMDKLEDDLLKAVV